MCFYFRHMVLLTGCLLELTAMAHKLARWGEFPKLVTDHVFNDEHIDVHFAVVNADGESHHFRRDR